MARSRKYVELTIERLSSSGDGVARETVGPNAGRVVFVKGTAPGDRVLGNIEEEHRRFARARVLRMLEEGPGRAEAFCPLFGECGSCTWQHLSPEVQRDARQAFVSEALRKIPRETEDELPRPLVFADARQGFRSRARLHVAGTSTGMAIGFRAAGSRSVVDVSECPVLDRALNQEYGKLRGRLSEFRSRGVAMHGTVVLTSGDQGQVAVSPRVDGVDDDELSNGTPVFRETVAVHGKRASLRVSPESFAQANRAMSDAIVETLLSHWHRLPGDPERVVELYAGGGNLTLPLALAGARVVAVEREGASVMDLLDTLRRTELTQRVDVAAADVDGLQGIAVLEKHRPDIVVLDPPREGAKLACGAIARLKPRSVVYVSCDMATLGRDLGVLAEAGYRLRDCVAFDMFPETPHVEALAVLVR